MTMNAKLAVKLFTGGRAVAHAQGLFQFTGSATEILDKRAVPPFYGANARSIPVTQIAIGGVGTLLADGTYWKTLPDNATLDPTVIVKGKDYYTWIATSTGGAISTNTQHKYLERLNNRYNLTNGTYLVQASLGYQLIKKRSPEGKPIEFEWKPITSAPVQIKIQSSP